MKKTDISKAGINKALIIKRLNAELLKHSKKNQANIKKTSGLSPSQISNVLTGGIDPSLEIVVLLAKALNKPIDYFLYGKNNNQPNKNDNSNDIKTLDQIKIPWIKGLSKDNKLIFKEKFFVLERSLTNEENLYCMTINDESMAPILKQNDIILIDHSIQHIEENKIYVFFKENSFVQTRRFCIYRGKILIKAENDNYVSYLTTKEKINIVGRAIKGFFSLE